MDTVVGTFQQTFISNNRTGNYIFDFLFSIIVVMIIKKLTAVSMNFAKFFDRFKKKYKSVYTIEGIVTQGLNSRESNILFPIEFSTIMYIINKNNINVASVKQYDAENESTDHYAYIINSRDNIQITDDIFVSQTETSHVSPDMKVKREIYKLSLHSKTLTLKELRNKLVEWTTEYKIYTKNNTGDFTYMFSCHTESIDGSKRIRNTNSRFISNKRFENIFFDGKDMLINRIDYFLNNENEYKRLGIPWTLGFLFHGEPGCGKTSSIKAIANYTGRHILDISLNRIKTCSELKSIFTSEYLGKYYVPVNKRIIIIEDIDCMIDIVRDRNESNFDSDDTDDDSDDNVSTTILEKNVKNVSKYKKKDDDQLTLSFILNLLDGILEQPGRIVIISSNYPEKLDKALIRPGRIDMKVEFKKCSSDICNQIINYYFKTKENHRFPEHKYTPAEIFEKCLNYNNNDKVVRALLN